MLTHINPKLPMRNKAITQDYYCNQLGFEMYGEAEYPHYLMVEKDRIQIHFFLFEDLDPAENYGQVYIRAGNIDKLYPSLLDNKIRIHPKWTFINLNLGTKRICII